VTPATLKVHFLPHKCGRKNELAAARRSIAMAAYSFLDVAATINGPGGSISIGNDAGTAEEGITIERRGDRNTMTIGADGSGMHSLHADKSATITVRLLKTSPTNNLLSVMFDIQSQASSLWGQNVIVVSTPSGAGDITTARQCAFHQHTPVTYAKEGGIMTWAFDAILTDGFLGVAPGQ
jgi:hypothetical protein